MPSMHLFAFKEDKYYGTDLIQNTEIKLCFIFKKKTPGGVSGVGRTPGTQCHKRNSPEKDKVCH
jgi:hypothetical protein